MSRGTGSKSRGVGEGAAMTESNPDVGATATGGETASRGLPSAKIAVGLAALVAVIILGRTLGGYIQPFAEWVEGVGVFGPVVFIFAYAAAVVAFVPASLLTLGAGAIFGIGPGTLYVFVAATLGSCLAFLVSRYVARAGVERRIEGNEKFARVDHAIAVEGRKIVFLLRLSPVFPFNLLNYALGLTKVSFADYAIASFGMIPGTLLYVYSGKIAGDVASVASGGGVDGGAGYWAVLALGMAATLAVTIVVTRTARRALGRATGV